MEISSMPYSLRLLFILCLSLAAASILPKAHGITPERLHVSKQGISDELFSSLEELSRLVDITYCVGATGIYKPFRCLSRCSEFSDFELLTVR